MDADTPGFLQAALDRREVSWSLLIEVSLLAYDDNFPEVQHRHLVEAKDIYEKAWKGEVRVLAPIGAVCLHGDGLLDWTFNQDQIRFDWSEVWPLTYQIELLAEEAREWWPGVEDEDDSPQLRPTQWGRKFVRFLKRSFVRIEKPASVRRPHSQRALSLASWILAAIGEENVRHPAASGTEVPPSTNAFKTDLDLYRRELRAAQKRFRASAQRTAQSRYWQGAIVGTAVLAMICFAGGMIFWWRGTNAAYGIAVPAGSLGAIVSVLQRMSSGKLVLDIDGSRDLLEVFGAVRPFIGAIFGLAVTALLVGGLIPAVEIPPGQELAFFGAIGFLAGFNERWAQDILRSSASQMGAAEAEESAVEEGLDPAAQASVR